MSLNCLVCILLAYQCINFIHFDSTYSRLNIFIIRASMKCWKLFLKTQMFSRIPESFFCCSQKNGKIPMQFGWWFNLKKVIYSFSLHSSGIEFKPFIYRHLTVCVYVCEKMCSKVLNWSKFIISASFDTKIHHLTIKCINRE